MTRKQRQRENLSREKEKPHHEGGTRIQIKWHFFSQTRQARKGGLKPSKHGETHIILEFQSSKTASQTEREIKTSAHKPKPSETV